MFDWLYPTHFPVILQCLEAWADVPAVTTPLLKFISEIAYNKSQRLQFDSSSPNGILLFREVRREHFPCIFRFLRSMFVATVDLQPKKCNG
jgi:exportin-7